MGKGRQRSCERDPDAEPPTEIPPAIVDKLRALVRRARRIQMVSGCFATLAAAAISLIVLMVIDATFTILSPTLHAALSLLALGVVLATAFQTLYRPLCSELSIRRMAQVIEMRHPELHERISTALELLGDRNPRGSRGSDQLIAQVVESAVSDADAFRPEREFSYRCARRYIVACAFVALIIGAASLIFPGASARLLTRAVVPWSPVGNAYAGRLQVEPGDRTVAAGDPLTIRVSIPGSTTQGAEIYRIDVGGTEHVEQLPVVSRDADAGATEFAITFPSVSDDFRYRIRSGRAVSASYKVAAAERPGLRRVEIAYEFPGYTGQAPLARTGVAQPISAISGTQIQVRAHFDRPLESAALKIDADQIAATDDRCSDPHNPQATWNLEMAEGTHGSWKIELVDHQSIPNRADENPIRAIADRPPIARLLGGQEELRVRPDERLSLGYEVEEDFGIASVSLRVGAGSAASYLPQDLPARSAAETYTGQIQFDVGQLEELAGSAPGSGPYQVYLLVTDNRPDPQLTEAGPVRIVIDPDARSLAEQLVEVQRDATHRTLLEAIARLGEARFLAAPIAGQLLRHDEIPEATRRDLVRIRELVGEVQSLVLATSDELSAPASLFKELAPGLSDIIDKHLTPARQAAEEIPLTDAKVTRVHRGYLIARHLDDGIADLMAAIREFKQQTSRAQRIATMSGLGDRQRGIADALAASTDPLDQARLREQQAGLAEAIGKLAEEGDRTASDHLQDAREIASGLAAQAAALARRQAGLVAMLDEAEEPIGDTLVSRQQGLAEQAEEVALSADEFRQRAESFADPSGLEKLQEASRLAQRAKRSAHQAITEFESMGLMESAVRPPALRAQRDLAEAADSLSDAAAGLAQQANLPSAKLRPAIHQEMHEIARQAEQLVLERNPETFSKRANSIANQLALAQTEETSPASVEDRQPVRIDLKPDTTAVGKSSVPEEYRDLVKSYFKEIARRSRESPPARP